MASTWTRLRSFSLNTLFTAISRPILFFRPYRMRQSKRFRLAGCRFVYITQGTMRVVTTKIPRRFYRERTRGKKELKAHRTMKEHLEKKKLREKAKEEEAIRLLEKNEPLQWRRGVYVCVCVQLVCVSVYVTWTVFSLFFPIKYWSQYGARLMSQICTNITIH